VFEGVSATSNLGDGRVRAGSLSAVCFGETL